MSMCNVYVQEKNKRCVEEEELVGDSRLEREIELRTMKGENAFIAFSSPGHHHRHHHHHPDHLRYEGGWTKSTHQGFFLFAE